MFGAPGAFNWKGKERRIRVQKQEGRREGRRKEKGSRSEKKKREKERREGVEIKN